MSLVDFGLVNLDGLVKCIKVEFGLGKANGLVKADVTNKQKKIHGDMLSCCAIKKKNKYRTGVAQHFKTS